MRKFGKKKQTIAAQALAEATAILEGRVRGLPRDERYQSVLAGPANYLAPELARLPLANWCRHRTRDSRDARPWIWINELAHASWSDLERIAETRTCGQGWEGALSYLASEMRTEGRSADGLLALQRNGLIPLELNLLARRAAPPMTPSDLISIVRSELDRIRRSPDENISEPQC
jgi:hypothetical protein